MRFRYNKNFIKIFVLFVILSATVITTSLSRVVLVNANDELCPPLPIIGMHVDGNVTAKVYVPDGFQDLTLILYTVEPNADGVYPNHPVEANIVQSAVTCTDTSSSAAHQILYAVFTEIGLGKFMVCEESTGICSDRFERGGSTAEGLHTEAPVFTLSAADLRGTKKEVAVILRINIPLSNESVTYGPYNIELKNGNSRIDSAATKKKTFSNGSIAKSIDLIATFKEVLPGTNYKACVQGTDKCSDKFEKKDDAKKTVIIRAGDVADLPDAGSTDPDGSCGAKVTGLGWIICPLITGMSELDDAMWKSVKALLNVSPLNQQGGETIYAAWGSIRSIANVLFVIFFLIIIFSQLTGVGITNYGVKKMLPKIIIAAILVNISYTIVQISVDLSNIIGSSLYTLIISLTPPVTYGWVDAVDLLEAIGASGAVAGIGIVGIIGVGGIGAAFWLLVPLALMAALGLVVAFLTLMFRQAAIPVLAIMAPLAFVAYLLPNTESLYQKWYKFLIGMLMMYPLAALVFGGAQFAGAVIIGNGENFWSLVTGLIIMALPLFSLPFLARQGGPMLSGLNGALTGMAQRARAPLNNWGRGRAAESRAAYLAADPNMRDNGHRRSFAARFTRNRAKRLDNARKTRAQDMKTDESRRESQWAESTRGRRGGGEGALDRAKQAGTTAERIKKETDARYDSSAVGMASADRLSEATKKAKAVENAATTRASNTGQGVTLDEELKRGELQTQGDTLRTASRVANDATPGGGIDLHQDLGEAQGRAAVDTQDIAHRFAVSGAGMALEDEQGAAELVARADKANTSYRTESDPTLLTIKLDAAGSEAMLKGAQAQTAQVVTEASSEGGRASVEAALGVLPGTSAEVTTLQTAQRTSDVATAATTEAQRQVTEEYQEAVAPRTPIGTPVPVTDTTRAAAGIGGLNARQRQQAKATSATSSRDEEDITARTTLVRSRSSSTTLISEAATEFTTAHSANDTVGISTATRILATSGGPGRAQLAQVADTVIPPGDISDATVRFKQELVAAGIVDRDAALGQFAVDPRGRSLAEIRLDPTTYQGQTPTQIARQSYEALHQAVVVHNAITYADAQATLTGPANVDLDDDRRALLRSIPP